MKILTAIQLTFTSLGEVCGSYEYEDGTTEPFSAITFSTGDSITFKFNERPDWTGNPDDPEAP